MKASDIIRLKSFGNYNVHVELLRLNRAIDQYISEDGLELNPDFQRGHVWTESQQIAFVEFMLRGGRTSPVLLNHPGWLGTFEGEFVCVDGLQRLTALLKFLNNDLPVFGGHLRNDIEGIDRLLRRHHIQIYINELKTKAEVLVWYLELNAGGTVHTEAELNKVRLMLAAADNDRVAVGA